MTRDKAVARIQQTLGFRRDLVDEAQAGLIEAQEDAESGELGFLPWFLRTRRVFHIPAGIISLALPRDYLREYDHEAFALWFLGIGPAQRVEYFSSTGDGTLKSSQVAYWVNTDNHTLELDRRYDSTVRAEYLYYKKDVVIEGNTENLWLGNGSQYLIGSAGSKMSGIQNSRAEQRFNTMMLGGKASLLRQDAAYRLGSRKPQFGAGTDRDYRNQISPGLRYNDLDYRAGD